MSPVRGRRRVAFVATVVVLLAGACTASTARTSGHGQASCMFRGSLGGKQLQAGPNVVDGQWHQVTCVRDGTQIVETVDGASFSVTKATGAITVTDPIRLGSHKNGGDWYKGVLDEVTYSIG